MQTMSQKMIDAVNAQINNEFYGSYSYLALVAYFESKNLPGFARWMRMQREEEGSHAMKLFELLINHNIMPTLQAIEQPRHSFHSPVEAFQFVVEHEKQVTENIWNLYDLAQTEKVFSIKIELDWFIREQVEEERTSRTIYEQLQMIGTDSAALMVLDRELAVRPPQVAAG